MALVTCNLCGKNISSRAVVCPKCGCPTLARKDSVQRSTKNCSECENAGIDGHYACNLCDGDSLRAFKPRPEFKKQQGQDLLRPSTDAADIDLLVKIDGLDIGSDLKSVFIEISATPFKSRLFGINSYTADAGELKYFRRLNSLTTICSNLAFLCGPFYYFMYMMWKKGAILLTVQLALFTGIVFGILPVSVVSLILLFVLHGICYCSAKYDRYRKLVLDEKFWW